MILCPRSSRSGTSNLILLRSGVQSAPDRIIQAIQRAYGGLKDDTTLIVLDLLPPGTQFQQVGRATDANGVVAGGGCLCFAPCVPPCSSSKYFLMLNVATSTTAAASALPYVRLPPQKEFG